MRQEITRAHRGWSLDSVILHNDMTRWMKEDIISSPPVSIILIVYGIGLMLVELNREAITFWQNLLELERYVHKLP